MVNRYVKINLKKRIAHAARPNVYISVLALLSLCDFKTLTETVSFQFSILLHVSSSSARSTKVYFDQKWSKKEEKPPWWFQRTVQQDISISIVRTFNVVEFKNLKPFSFQLSIPTYISLFVQDVERIHFDQRWSEKKLDHLSLRPDDRCHFELCWNLHVLRWKFRP